MQECETGAYLYQNRIFYRENKVEKGIMPIGQIKLPGMHNVENMLAAISAVIPEVSIKSIVSVAKNFSGVEHRNEFVRSINGVSFYNDSIGSSPTRTTATIKAFNNKVILIAGGYDKISVMIILGNNL